MTYGIKQIKCMKSIHVSGIIPDDSKNLNFGKKKVHKVLNVAPMIGTNPRSILLPVNTGNGIRTYKIVTNGNGRKTLKAIGSLGNGNPMVLKTIRPVGVPVVRYSDLILDYDGELFVIWLKQKQRKNIFIICVF